MNLDLDDDTLAFALATDMMEMLGGCVTLYSTLSTDNPESIENFSKLKAAALAIYKSGIREGMNQKDLASRLHVHAVPAAEGNSPCAYNFWIGRDAIDEPLVLHWEYEGNTYKGKIGAKLLAALVDSGIPLSVRDDSDRVPISNFLCLLERVFSPKKHKTMWKLMWKHDGETCMYKIPTSTAKLLISCNTPHSLEN